MKRVYIAANPADAHLLKGLLEGEDIPAVIQGEFLWNVRGEIPITEETRPSVWVNDSDYDRAMELVATFVSSENPPPEEGKEWKCNGCGELNESQFTECWQCGKSRPV